MATSTEPELDRDGPAGPPSAAGEPAPTTRADVFMYVARKLGSLVLVSLLVATLTFVVSRATADPSFLMVGQDATDEIIAARRAEMGLDQPMYRQWASYMADLARGDLGISRRTFAPVGGEIFERRPATVELAGAALLLSLLVAIPGGIRAGLRPDGWADRIVGSVAQLGAAIPNFWLGLMLIYFGFYWLRWFPRTYRARAVCGGSRSGSPVSSRSMRYSLVTGRPPASRCGISCCRRSRWHRV